MTLARILLKLWKLRLWLVPGVLLAGIAAAATIVTSQSTVYASASTQMLVDSPSSTLANAQSDMTGYVARAVVFARLMTSTEALSYIGKAAGVPGNLIDANGPLEVNGSATASHAAIQIQGGTDRSVTPTYKLSFDQNPDLPTVDVYAEAPTTAKAIALANGAVTGFSSFLSQSDGNAKLAPDKRIEVRQLGSATGGMVDSGASKKIAVLAFLAVLALWCGVILFASHIGTQLHVARRTDSADSIGPADPVGAGAPFDVAEEHLRNAEVSTRGDRSLRFALEQARLAATQERGRKARNGRPTHNGHGTQNDHADNHDGHPDELVGGPSTDALRDGVGPTR